MKYHIDGLITRDVRMRYLKSHVDPKDQKCKLGHLAGSDKLHASYRSLAIDETCGMTKSIYEEDLNSDMK